MNTPNDNTSMIVLREVVDGDLPIFFEHQNDPIANQMAAFTREDPSDWEAFLAHWARIRSADDIIIRTIMLDGQVAGSVASFVDKQMGKPEVTYWIGREHWGKGVATSALKAFLRIQTTRPLYGRAAKDNAGSIRVLEKCGFTIFKTVKGFANARSEEIEEVVMMLR